MFRIFLSKGAHIVSYLLFNHTFDSTNAFRCYNLNNINKKFILSCKSNDYDFFYRLIAESKINGISTKREEVIGNFRSGGFSSKLGFFDRLFMELRIRFNNRQNFFDLFIIFFGRCFYETKNKLKL